MELNAKRQRRSEKLTPEEFDLFKKWVESFDTLTDAYEELGVAKSTMRTLLVAGSGHPDTISKIKVKIGVMANA